VEFKTPYVLAMRERAPKMFKALCRSGRLKEHLQEESVEAHRLFDQLMAGVPMEESGYPKQPWAREAEEQVFATLIEFPPENEPNCGDDPLASVPTET
jgi:hypothetical protein